MRTLVLFLGLALIPSLHARPAAPQENQATPQETQATPTLGWVTLGLGGGAGTGQDPVAIGAELAIQHGPHLFSGRALGFGELFGVDSEATELALLYGRGNRGRRLQTGYSAGISFLECDRMSFCGKGGPWDQGDSSISTVGLALSGQLFWAPARVFGLGLWGFATISPKGSTAGAMLGLRFGKLR